MVNYHVNIVDLLRTINLPVHYEMVLHRGLSTPCLSYMELSNNVISQGDTVSYSEIEYQIKCWGTSIKEILEVAQQVENVLRPYGWVRTSTTELADNNSNMIQKIMTFRRIFREKYN